MSKVIGDDTCANDITMDAIKPWANLRGARLNAANLYRADLPRAKLINASLRYTNLSRADLREANLIGADLRWADLTEAILCGAILYLADLAGTRLKGAKYDKHTIFSSEFNPEDHSMINVDEENNE